ncbi:sugar transferase [Enterococcus faecium]|uniref:sugar transferase n=1 Tax=Enterococcus faecium TaxID=1352 RepID=UPI0002A33A57|nr:hypothetical protein OIQ_03971 [Enterococcus faecium EnGen0025]
MIDIIESVIGLFLTSPLMIYAFYRIRKEEPRIPLCFSHTRVVKNGKILKIYKLCSMYLDAEEKVKELLFQNKFKDAMLKL